MIIRIDDTVADALTDQPQLRSLYFKLLGLYSSVGGVFFVSNIPFFVFPTGEVYHTQHTNITFALTRTVKPKSEGRPPVWEDDPPEEYEAFDEILIVANGLLTQRYDWHDREYFERGSQIYLTILDGSVPMVGHFDHTAPLDRTKLI